MRCCRDTSTPDHHWLTQGFLYQPVVAFIEVVEKQYNQWQYYGLLPTLEQQLTLARAGPIQKSYCITWSPDFDEGHSTTTYIIEKIGASWQWAYWACWSCVYWGAASQHSFTPFGYQPVCHNIASHRPTLLWQLMKFKLPHPCKPTKFRLPQVMPWQMDCRVTRHLLVYRLEETVLGP